MGWYVKQIQGQWKAPLSQNKEGGKQDKQLWNQKKKKKIIIIMGPSSHKRRRKMGQKEKLKVGEIKLYIYGIVLSRLYTCNTQPMRKHVFPHDGIFPDIPSQANLYYFLSLPYVCLTQ